MHAKIHVKLHACKNAHKNTCKNAFENTHENASTQLSMHANMHKSICTSACKVVYMNQAILIWNRIMQGPVVHVTSVRFHCSMQINLTSCAWFPDLQVIIKNKLTSLFQSGMKIFKLFFCLSSPEERNNSKIICLSENYSPIYFDSDFSHYLCTQFVFIRCAKVGISKTFAHFSIYY